MRDLVKLKPNSLAVSIYWHDRAGFLFRSPSPILRRSLTKNGQLLGYINKLQRRPKIICVKEP